MKLPPKLLHSIPGGSLQVSKIHRAYALAKDPLTSQLINGWKVRRAIKRKAVDAALALAESLGEIVCTQGPSRQRNLAFLGLTDLKNEIWGGTGARTHATFLHTIEEESPQWAEEIEWLIMENLQAVYRRIVKEVDDLEVAEIAYWILWADLSAFTPMAQDFSDCPRLMPRLLRIENSYWAGPSIALRLHPLYDDTNGQLEAIADAPLGAPQISEKLVRLIDERNQKVALAASYRLATSFARYRGAVTGKLIASLKSILQNGNEKIDWMACIPLASVDQITPDLITELASHRGGWVRRQLLPLLAALGNS